MKLIKDNRRMSDKKNLCRFDDYVESKSSSLNHTSMPFTEINNNNSEYKLDRGYPKNISIKFDGFKREFTEICDRENNIRCRSTMKILNSTENKFYHEYLNIKNGTGVIQEKKLKIAHIFNIRSINLVQKVKTEAQKSGQNARIKYSSKECKSKIQKQNIREINLILNAKKSKDIPVQPKRTLLTRKNASTIQAKMLDLRPPQLLAKPENHFDTKLNEYYSVIRSTCDLHKLQMKQIENYPKNSLFFYVGRGNNQMLIKECIKKRWWWSITQDKNKKFQNFIWTQLKEKNYYLKKEKRSISQYSTKRSQSQIKSSKDSCDLAECIQSEIYDTQIHNHFQNNEFLGNKKALYYNMKAFYESLGQKPFDYIPVTFHIKKFDDQAWKAFTKYYQQDRNDNLQSGLRLWIVKPGQNTNRGNGITIHNDYQKIRQLIMSQISGDQYKKSFIIQKYIDKPFLYNKRKFDIRCYMLLVRLNGKIKGYWYNEGYIRTSCYQFQLTDCENEFVHLTNDAIQVNCQKYGKYEDGNKLSYQHFQKYLDANYKNKYNFNEEICPKLKKIGTDSILASYHLLGKWNNLPTFEIFGLDFMIDQNFKPWLIQINTNPCLQTNSSTLQRVIPRMVDSAFKLSLDALFPPPQNWLNSKKHNLPNKFNNNLFQLIFDEEQSQKICKTMTNEIIVQMGEIEQDNQVYDENDHPRLIQ